MFTHHTSPGGAAVPHAGSDRPRGDRRKKIRAYPTGGWRHRQSLCRPSEPGTSCEQPLLQLHTSCLPKAPAPEGRHYLMPGPTGPGVEEGKEFHPIPPVAVATGNHCAGPPSLEHNASNLCCSYTPHVYPQYQPRRGGSTLAGAVRPRGGRRKRVPSSPTATEEEL